MQTIGYKIHQLLLSQSLENPIIFDKVSKWGDKEYVKTLETKLSDFLGELGFDLSSEALSKTPNRVVEMFINEFFYGLNYNNFPQISVTTNDCLYNSPIWSQGITVRSICEHHLVSIKGIALLGYIPNKNIVGLSKLNQVVDFFARRPQIQERLTRQICVALTEILETEDVAIAISAVHGCIVDRGIKDTGSRILSIDCGGKFQTDLHLKEAFYNMANMIKG